MTFNFSVALSEIIKKELKISHFNIKVFVGKLSRMQNKYKELIKKQFGNTYLADANYVLFFTGMLNSNKLLKQLADILTRSFGGKIKVSVNELKKLDMNDSESDDDVEDDDTESDDEEDDTEYNIGEAEDEEDQEDLDIEQSQSQNDVYFLKITLN